MIPFNPLYNLSASMFAWALVVAAVVAVLLVVSKYREVTSDAQKSATLFALFAMCWVTARLMVTDSSIKNGRMYEVTPLGGSSDDVQFLNLDRQTPGELVFAGLVVCMAGVCMIMYRAYQSRRVLMLTTGALTLLVLTATLNAAAIRSFEVSAPQWSTLVVLDGMLRDLLFVAIPAYVIHTAYCGVMIARSRIKMNAQRQMLDTPAKAEIVPGQRPTQG